MAATVIVSDFENVSQLIVNSRAMVLAEGIVAGFALQPFLPVGGE